MYLNLKNNQINKYCNFFKILHIKMGLKSNKSAPRTYNKELDFIIFRLCLWLVRSAVKHRYTHTYICIYTSWTLDSQPFVLTFSGNWKMTLVENVLLFTSIYWFYLLIRYCWKAPVWIIDRIVYNKTMHKTLIGTL